MANYPEAIYAIADFKQPPVDVMKVANWHLVRFTAKIFRRTAREVAADVIDCSIGQPRLAGTEARAQQEDGK